MNSPKSEAEIKIDTEKLKEMSLADIICLAIVLSSFNNNCK